MSDPILHSPRTGMAGARAPASRRTVRTRVLLPLALLAAIGPEAALALPDLSAGVSTHFGFGGYPQGCASCHLNNTQVRKAAGGQFKPFASDLADVFSDAVLDAFAAGTIAGPAVAAEAARAAGVIEGAYVPRVAPGQASIVIDASGTPVDVAFDPGRTLSGNVARLLSLGLASTADFTITQVDNAARIAFTGDLVRRTALRAGGPVTLRFVPVNATVVDTVPPSDKAGFRPVATLANSVVTVSFANLPPVANGAAFTIAATDTQFAGNIVTASGDRDPDSAVFTVELRSGPAFGTLSAFGPDGSFTYLRPGPPLATDPAAATFTYRLVDGDGAVSADATVTIALERPANFPPVAADDSYTTAEDTPLSGNVLTDGTPDRDDDGDPLSVTGFTQPKFGTVSIAPDGAFTYTPDPDRTGNAQGRDSFDYTVSDGTDSDTARVTVTVTPVNDPPVALADTFSTDADTPLAGANVLGNDSDVDSPTLTAVRTGGDPLVTLAADGTLSFTPPDPAITSAATTSITYRAVDDQGAQSADATVTIQIRPVNAVNTPPVARDDSYATAEDTAAAGNLLTDGTPDSDADGDALSVTAFTQPRFGAVAVAADGAFTYTPDPDATGNAANRDSFTYTLSDGTDTATARVTVTIAPVNDAPVAADDLFATDADTPLAGANVLANDRDVDSVTITAVKIGGDPLATLAADGTVSFTPPDPAITAAASTSITYRAEDDSGARSTVATVTIQIRPVGATNTAPVASDDAYATDEDVAVTGNLLTDGTPDADADGDALTATIETRPQLGTATVAGDGSFTYTPDPDATGDAGNLDSFTYRVSDGRASATGTVTVTIRPVNDAPVAGTILPLAINEEQGPQSFDLLDPAFVRDVDGDALIVSGVRRPVIVAPTLANPRLPFTVNGTRLEFDPIALDGLDAGETATVSFDYRISDGTAPAIDGRIEITILGLENDISRVAGEYANTLAARYNDHFLRSNNPGACLTCHKVGRVNVNINTRADCNRQDMTEYGFLLCRARDANQPPLTDLPRRLQVVEPGFAPNLASVPSLEVTIGTPVGDPVGTPLQANAGRNVEGEPSRVVAFSFFAGGLPVPRDPNGLFSIGNDGQIRVAAPLVAGTYFLDIRPINDAKQRDPNGAVRPGIRGFYPIQNLPGVVTVTVRDVLPVAVDDGANVEAGTPADLDLTRNDTDGTPASLAVVRAPANGTVTVSGLVATYTANPAFTGTDTFTYRTRNPVGSSNTATVTLRVVAPGGAIARDDLAATVIDQPVVVDVLANDGGGGLSVAIVTPPDPAEGTASVAGNRIRFVPAAGFTGTASLVYEARNASGASQATLRVTVSRVSGDLFAGATQDPELARVARALGDSCAAVGTPGSADAQDLVDVCTTIAADIGAGAGIDPALAALRNEEALAVADQALTFGRTVQETIRQRLSRLRTERAGGVDVSGLAVTMGEEALDGARLGPAVAALFGGPGDGLAESPWGFFVAGDVTFGEADATARRQSFDLVSLSLTFGADYRFGDTMLAGLAASYAVAETDFDGGGGLDGSSLQLSAYGLYQGFGIEGLSLTGIATFGIDSWDQSRRIAFVSNGVTIDRTALADYSGSHLNISAQLAWSMPLSLTEGAFELPGSFEIFGGPDFLVAWVDGYTETGAGGLNLAVESQTYESFLLTLGAELRQPFVNAWGVFEPYGRLTLNAELLDDDRTLTARFLAAGPAAPGFTVTEAGTGSFYATIEVGTSLKLVRGELDLALATTVGSDSLTSHRVGVAWRSEVFGNDRLGLGLGLAPGETDPGFDLALDYELRF